MFGVERLQIASEASDHGQPLAPPVGVPAGGSGPRDRRSACDDLRPVVLQLFDEAMEQLGAIFELEPHRPPDGDVVLEHCLQVAHDSVSGQDRASSRRRSRSTLAYIVVVDTLRWRSTCPTSIREAPARSISVAAVCRST